MVWPRKKNKHHLPETVDDHSARVGARLENVAGRLERVTQELEDKLADIRRQDLREIQ